MFLARFGKFCENFDNSSQFLRKIRSNVMRFTTFLQNGMPKKTRKSRPWAEKSTHSCRLLVVRTASPRAYAIPKSVQLCDGFKKLHYLIAPTAEKIFVHFSLKCRACQPGPFSRVLQHRTFCRRLKTLDHSCKKKGL